MYKSYAKFAIFYKVAVSNYPNLDNTIRDIYDIKNVFVFPGVSAAVRFYHHLCGCLPPGSPLRPPQQLDGDPPRCSGTQIITYLHTSHTRIPHIHAYYTNLHTSHTVLVYFTNSHTSHTRIPHILAYLTYSHSSHTQIPHIPKILAYLTCLHT